MDSTNYKIHNHVDLNDHLVSKKGLFLSLKEYYSRQKQDCFQVIPVTFHLKSYKDPEIKKF